MRISIRANAHNDGTRSIYKGDTLIGTISNEKPNRSNNRVARYGIAWITGRFEWFDTYTEARDQALKGA